MCWSETEGLGCREKEYVALTVIAFYVVASAFCRQPFSSSLLYGRATLLIVVNQAHGKCVGRVTRQTEMECSASFESIPKSLSLFPIENHVSRVTKIEDRSDRLKKKGRKELREPSSFYEKVLSKPMQRVFYFHLKALPPFIPLPSTRSTNLSEIPTRRALLTFYDSHGTQQTWYFKTSLASLRGVTFRYFSNHGMPGIKATLRVGTCD